MRAYELLVNRLSPFRHRNFRNFYSVQAISLLGNWMQELARSWIVIQLAGSSTAIASLLFAAAVPNLLFGSYGGVLSDRRGIRKILLVTQVLFATLAFALGTLIQLGHIQIWHLVIFALLEGTIIAFDLPAFNKITPQLVPREDFQQALALNAVNFHLSRVIGPALAGIIMAISGPATVFWLNAVSFLGIVVVIRRLPFTDGAPTETPARMGEAITYVRRNPVLFRILLQFTLLMSLVFPLVFTTLRILVQSRFHLDEKQYGLIFSAPGLGALMGSLTFLLWKPKNPLKALPGGLTGITLLLLAIAKSSSLVLTMALLVGFSYCMFLSISSMMVTSQLTIENYIRGRVSALFGMAFVSLSPIMSLPLALVSDLLGEERLLVGVSLVFGLSSLVLQLRSKAQSNPI